jgi:mannose/fructose/N-acetylgalactosamine-specific phosphotransferase system component IIB
LVIVDVLLRIYEVCGLEKYRYYAKLFGYVDHIKIVKELLNGASASISKVNDFVNMFDIDLKHNGLLFITDDIDKIEYLLDMGVDINEVDINEVATEHKHGHTKIK